MKAETMAAELVDIITTVKLMGVAGDQGELNILYNEIHSARHHNLDMSQRAVYAAVMAYVNQVLERVEE